MKVYGSSEPAANKADKQVSLKIAIIAGIVLIAICATIITYLFVTKSTVTVPTTVMTGNTNLALDATAMKDESNISVADDMSGGDMVVFQGYEDTPVNQGQAIQLSNSVSNVDVYMKYVIMNDNGEIIFETGLISPGEYVRVVLSEYLNPGEYQLYLKQEAYSMNDAGGFDYITDATSAAKVTVLE